MKTVLFVGTGSGFGGSAVCLNNLIRYLDPGAYRPIVAHLGRGLAIKRIEAQGVPIVPLDRRWMGWQLARLIRRERVDLVHANNELYSHVPTILAARATRRPCVVHMRGIRPLTRRERWAIRLVDHFIIISEIGRRFYLKEGVPDERTSVIYDGMDLAVFDGHADREAMRRRLGVAPSEVLLGFVSRLEPKKGVQDFLDAFALVQRACPQARAVVVGGDPDHRQAYFRELVQRARALGLSSRVTFTGWRDDVPSLTSAFDVAVQASHYMEGFGTSVMEAMALGKPVVATAVGGIPELVEEHATALLVPSGDWEALAQAIIRLVREPQLRARMGASGRRRVEERFNQARLTTQVEALYARLLNGKRP
jgi:glycosyltransferase involved in cell wall biosynthesis